MILKAQTLQKRPSSVSKGFVLQKQACLNKATMEYHTLIQWAQYFYFKIKGFLAPNILSVLTRDIFFENK